MYMVSINVVQLDALDTQFKSALFWSVTPVRLTPGVRWPPMPLRQSIISQLNTQVEDWVFSQTIQATGALGAHPKVHSSTAIRNSWDWWWGVPLSRGYSYSTKDISGYLHTTPGNGRYSRRPRNAVGKDMAYLLLLPLADDHRGRMTRPTTAAPLISFAHSSPLHSIWYPNIPPFIVRIFLAFSRRSVVYHGSIA